MMKMQSLKHFGILVPRKHILIGYTVFIKKKAFQFQTSKQEEMAFTWVKKLGTPYVEDPVFKKNFFSDFCKELGVPYTEDINFEQLIFSYEKFKSDKEHMTKEEKKKGREERKKQREINKSTYGYALVDGLEVEIANYMAEPSSIFMGRGKHPLRGRWKEGPRKEDITLNLSPDASRLSDYKKIVWKPNKMFVASWVDKLSGKTKYVWFADSWGKKQKREKAKFDKAKKLGKNLKKVEHLINSELLSGSKERRKIACVCYLIFHLNLRVGDEKDPGEADTVGAITLRPDHIVIIGNIVIVYFDFLGKDSVRWEKKLVADPRFVKSIQGFQCRERPYLFKGINSKMVSSFLSKVQEGLTAKVFRTYRATEAVRAYFEDLKLESDEPEFVKRAHFKLACLEASKICNHKKALPKGYPEKLQKKVDRIKETRKKIREKKKKGKSTSSLALRLSKQIIQKELYEKTSEWNLNTSMKSYISPIETKSWLDKVNLPCEKVYSRTLLKKFSWCFK